jgi:transcriptional regulatory protein GAL4
MEIRRRVWWVMTVFDIGAEITFGRPVLMPAGGFEVALPMNIHDWVSDLFQLIAA